MIAGLAPNLESPLVRQISSVYAFVYRTIISSGFHRDANRLADALRVLEIERETWQQVCDRLGWQTKSLADRSHDERAATTPLAINLPPLADGPYSSLSFEA